MRLVVYIVGMLVAQNAMAGPWPRPDGTHFLSYSIEYSDRDGGIFGSAYYEYGYDSRLTLGLDIGATERDLYKSVIFARYPVAISNTNLKSAFEIGVGLTDEELVLRPGISVGKVLSFLTFNGWMSINTLLPVAIKSGRIHTTTDATFGLDWSAKSKFILQIQSDYDLSDYDYVNVAPSLVIEYKTDRHLELGAVAGVLGSSDFSLKVGVWRHF